MADVETKPLVTYITRHLLIHDGVEYPAGSEFRHPDEAVIKAARRAGCLALPNELQTAEATAQQLADAQATIARLQAEAEAGRAALARERAAALQEDAEAEAAKKAATPKKAAKAEAAAE